MEMDMGEGDGNGDGDRGWERWRQRGIDTERYGGFMKFIYAFL